MSTNPTKYKPGDIVTKFYAPGLPPSVNAIYNRRKRGGSFFKQKEAVNALDCVAIYAPAMTLRKAWYHLKFTCLIDLYHGNGTVKKWDADNRAKPLIDSLMRRWSLDDRYLMGCSPNKGQKESGTEDGIKVILRYVGELNPEAHDYVSIKKKK